jgi:hypothetical protein
LSTLLKKAVERLPFSFSVLKNPPDFYPPSTAGIKGNIAIINSKAGSKRRFCKN